MFFWVSYNLRFSYCSALSNRSFFSVSIEFYLSFLLCLISIFSMRYLLSFGWQFFQLLLRFLQHFFSRPFHFVFIVRFISDFAMLSFIFYFENFLVAPGPFLLRFFFHFWARFVPVSTRIYFRFFCVSIRFLQCGIFWVFFEIIFSYLCVSIYISFQCHFLSVLFCVFISDFGFYSVRFLYIFFYIALKIS